MIGLSSVYSYVIQKVSWDTCYGVWNQLVPNVISRGVVFNEEKMANLIKYSEEDISSEKNFKIEVETFYKSHEEENQELQV